MIIRELFARLGLKTDKQSFDRGSKAMDRVKKAALSLGALFATGAVARGFLTLVNAASDAQETLNVLGASFGENQKAVEEWAKSTSKAMGRSEFELQKFAGTLGAILNPMLKSEDAAAEMSTTLSQLAVDMASFHNTTDLQALEALRSGLVGSSEPLFRYGINLTEVNLKEEARRRGITKSIQKMSIQEKTVLRFNAIMTQSANAQGDAVRTADGYANSTKRLQSRLIDIGTTIGLRFLGPMEKVVHMLVGVVDKMDILIKETNILEAALGVLGAALVVVGAKFVIAFAAPTAIGLALAAVLAIIVLAVDDIITSFKGGDSLGRRFNDTLEDIYNSFSRLGEADKFLQVLLVPLQTIVDLAVLAKDAMNSLVSLMTGGGMAGYRQLYEDASRKADKFLERTKPLRTGTEQLLGLTTQAPLGRITSSPRQDVSITVNAQPGQSPESIGQATSAAVRRQWSSMVDEAADELLPLVSE